MNSTGASTYNCGNRVSWISVGFATPSYQEALPSCPWPAAITRTRLPFDTHPSRSERQQLLNCLPRRRLNPCCDDRWNSSGRAGALPCVREGHHRQALPPPAQVVDSHSSLRSCGVDTKGRDGQSAVARSVLDEDVGPLVVLVLGIAREA